MNNGGTINKKVCVNEEESDHIRCIAEAHQAYIKLNWEYITSRDVRITIFEINDEQRYSGIHPYWMTKHDLTTREAIEEEINF